MSETAAAYYKKLKENSAVSCLLCPKRCLIQNGEAGYCGARANRGGSLYADNYGVVSSMAFDPIEKKPFAEFCPGAMVLSFGGFGCNMDCPHCQNHSISAARLNEILNAGGKKAGAAFKRVSPAELVSLALQKVPEKNIGAAFTYNEPLISFEYIRDCAPLLAEAGLKTVLVTNGFINREPLAELLPYIDALNIDLKGFTSGFYESLGGNLQTVKDSIALARAHSHVEVTTLVIPNENDSPYEIEALALFISKIDPDIPLHLSRFFPRHRSAAAHETPRETILLLKKTAEKHLRRVYTGNMH